MEGLYLLLLVQLLPCIFGLPNLGPLDCSLSQERFSDADIEDYSVPRVMSLNDKVYLQCKEEYYEQQVFVKCAGEDMLFYSRPWCKLVRCPYLWMPQNGRYSQESPARYKDPAVATCDDGFTYTGDVNKTCKRSGQWSGTEGTCERIVCPTEQILNGIIHGHPPFYLNSTRHVECQPGFVYIGVPDAFCKQDEHWSESLGKCQDEVEIKCPISVLTGDKINIQPRRDTHGYNQSVSISCEEGYEYQGKATLRCQAGNKWSGEVGKCIRIVCKNYITKIKNGHISGSHICDYGSKLEITCEPPYVYVGEEIKCGGGGEWNGDIGYCQAMCPPSWNISKGQIKVTVVTPGSMADVICDEGLSLEGKNYSLCQSDGHWSEPGTCLGKDDAYPHFVLGWFLAGIGACITFAGLIVFIALAIYWGNPKVTRKIFHCNKQESQKCRNTSTEDRGCQWPSTSPLVPKALSPLPLEGTDELMLC